MRQPSLLKVELKRVMQAKELLEKLLRCDITTKEKEAYHAAKYRLQCHEDALIDEIEMSKSETTTKGK